jgi:cytochrome c peroxidase
MSRPAILGALLWLCSAAALAGAQDFEINDDAPTPVPSVPPHPSAAAVEALGRKLFSDRDLSASRQMSCATCHDPGHAYGPPNALPAQRGGPNQKAQGQRAVPSLRYLQRVPVFTEHYYDEDFDESVDNGPTGGLTWDGRAENPHDQARLPLLSPLEMANGRPEDVIDRVRTSKYAEEFKAVFGAGIFDQPSKAFDAVTRALEVFEQNPTEFYPYSSKYDAALRHQVTLSEQEQRGLALFNDPAKGNCARCHQSAIGSGGGFPAFTDFGFIAVAVPRNRQLDANRDPEYHDLGLCGPLRADLRDRHEYCGLFRTPSLRNVALRQTFFHNGAFHDLTEVVRFYVDRDIHPERWYVHAADGKVVPYDDLPAMYHGNVNREPPFDRGPGDAPSLSEAEIADVVAFLRTLTDGWSADGAQRTAIQ